MKAPVAGASSRRADPACMHAALCTHDTPRLVRVFSVPAGQHPDPLHMRRDARNRFDPPGGGFHVLYAAFHLDVCLAEVLSRGPAGSPPQTDRTPVARYFVGELFPAEPLRMVDLTQALPPHALAGDAMASLPDCQALSEAVHRFVPRADGIVYRAARARHSGSRAVALFQRGVERAGVRAGSVVPLPWMLAARLAP